MDYIRCALPDNMNGIRDDNREFPIGGWLPIPVFRGGFPVHGNVCGDTFFPIPVPRWGINPHRDPHPVIKL